MHIKIELQKRKRETTLEREYKQDPAPQKITSISGKQTTKVTFTETLNSSGHCVPWTCLKTRDC